MIVSRMPMTRDENEKGVAVGNHNSLDKLG
jgi:hypothetical protein